MTTERWALVPAEAPPEMEDAAFDVLEIDTTETAFKNGTEARNTVFSAMIQASPGAALLAEVLAARDDAKESAAADKRDGGYGVPDQQSWLRVIHALDKLGPTQSSEGTKA